jgi:hypothetical protein
VDCDVYCDRYLNNHFLEGNKIVRWDAGPVVRTSARCDGTVIVVAQPPQLHAPGMDDRLPPVFHPRGMPTCAPALLVMYRIAMANVSATWWLLRWQIVGGT